LTIIYLTVLTVLTACDYSNRVKTNRRLLGTSTEKKQIKQFFTAWQAQEIKAKHFYPKNWCNPDSFLMHNRIENLDSIKGLIYGFPSDTTEFKFSFADLNNDGKLDGLVVFTPNQCDGGNASEWIQWQVFILSNSENYSVTDTIHMNTFRSTNFNYKGFYWLDSITTNKIFGTYSEFKKDDGRCCPSINKKVIFDFAKRELITVGGNIDRK